MYAANRGEKDFVEMLINAKADVTATGNNGYTALTWVIEAWTKEREHVKEIAEMLINAGVDLNSKDNDGYTALMWVAGARRKEPDVKEMAELLINAGADVNAVNDDSTTALVRATNRKYNNVVELLKASGAKNPDSESAKK